MNTPIALSEAEIKELANSEVVREAFQMDPLEIEDNIRDHWNVKFTNYITDGPGYSGELFVLVGGVPSALIFSRGKDDFVLEDNY